MATEKTESLPALREAQVNHTSPKQQMEHINVPSLAGKLEHLAQNTPLRFSAEALRPLTKNTSRFGNLSQHSFFSRHSPHPHRVTHIQGLNGSPICIVNDDWSVTSPLYPHPMVKRQFPTNTLGVPCSIQVPIGDPYGNMVPYLGSAAVSEAWREELKELAAKVCTSDKQLDIKEVEEPRRSTQYSAETGRLIPPSSRAMTRQASRKANRNNINNKGKSSSVYLQDQELMILELLCQILQTDSLSAIQQWLLSAGQREKDLVMGMIQTATANTPLEPQTIDRSMGDKIHSHTVQRLMSRDEHLERKSTSSKSNHKMKQEPISEEDKPERIGSAEVLQVHSQEDENQSKPGSSK
ncbi:protein TBATA [Bombina bombina]|uniref:protein TBATA n=1 Tax=Bombina bombina TaxID=8345 RepID=UPI00235ADEF4|nr:protein TBATA [Bombina bombina]